MSANPSLIFLRNPNWWKQSFTISVKFFRQFIFPALGLALANIVMLFGAFWMSQSLNHENVTLEMLTQAAIIAGVSALIGLVLSLWVLALWLMRLTAFCRLLLETPDGNAVEFRKCLDEISARRWWLSKLWLIGSVYLLLPVGALCALITIKTLIDSPYGFLGLEQVPWIHSVIILGIAVLCVGVTSYTLALMVVAASSKLSAGKAAQQSIELFWSNRPNLVVLSILVLLVNLIISAPQTVFGLNAGSINITQDTLILQIVQQIWLGISSAVLWPWSLIPYCKLLRAPVE